MHILDLCVCFFLAIIAGTGVGGGGLFLVYMTEYMGIPQISAQAVNLFYFLSAAIPATVYRRKSLPWKLAGICSAAGIPGVIFGSMLRDLMDGDLQKKILGGILMASGAAVFLLRDKTE